jgi:DNA polymerase-3 subunit gamma/tau
VNAPTTEPCGTCESCVSIAAASSLDVIEMDAASSNSVDDIRALRESVAYAPVSGGQKVYILDEAHMLSTAAWNAFLKTLEEPPPNTVFVLATTEAQKVLPTVIDRCHRFDFQRPTADQIATVLRRTATAEGIVVPPAAIALLARHAAGSFRDALGTLEQLRTYSGDEILLEDVLAVLGVADAELLFTTVDAIAAGDARAALLAVAGCVDAGRDPAGFIRELEIHVREVLVVRTLGGQVPAELAITPERDEQLVEQAGRVPAATLVRLQDLLAAALAALRSGADGRTQLELAVVKAATPQVDAGTDALLERIARLEAALASPLPRAVARQEPAPPPPPDGPLGVDAEGAAPPAAVVVPAAPPAPAGELTLERLVDLWPAVLVAVGQTNKMLAAVIADAAPVELTERRLVLAFPADSAFLRRKADDQPNRKAVCDAVHAVTGRTLSLAYDLRELEGSAVGTAAPLTEEEWVVRLKAEFDGEELGDEERLEEPD